LAAHRVGPRSRRHAALAILACAAAGGAAAADPGPPLPVWETGPGLALITYPDYRGADHYNFTALPLPYLLYRGDRLRVGREGIKAQLLASERLDVSLSAAFALPGNTDNPDSARAGMPELMPTFEIGPSFDWWLTRHSSYEDWSWRLRAPVRSVAASNFRKIDQAGWVTHPLIQVDRRLWQAPWSFHVSANAGVLFANHKYHAYFYAVPPEYATAARPAYDPDGGYSGARVAVFGSAGRGRWRVGLGVLQDWLGGAAFVDSPLVETRDATLVWLGFTYRLWQSRDNVAEEPSE
jgi:MipA family protein